MSNQPLTDEFLTNLRETYRASQPVLDETLHEASELSKFFTAFRYMLEVMPLHARGHAETVWRGLCNNDFLA